MERRSDKELIAQAVATGSRRAFGVLVGRYQSAIRRFFLHQTCGDAVLSDDLAQDCFVKAFTSIRLFRGEAQFSTWLFRIAFNVWIDHQRHVRPAADIDQITVAVQHGSNAAAMKMDIYNALATLSERERLCVTLQLVDGYSIDEISGITQMPRNTVKSHLFRGKEKLTAFLRNNGYDRKR